MNTGICGIGELNERVNNDDDDDDIDIAVAVPDR